MAKDTTGAARKTLELPGLEALRKPGRPPTGKALTSAERQEAYRQRRRAEFAQWLKAVYERGYQDGEKGLPLAPSSTWESQELAIAFLSSKP